MAGTVFYLQSGGADGEGGGGGGSSIVRYRLSDRRAAPFVSGAADFTVSADGRKLLYRTGGGGGGRGGGPRRGGRRRRARACSSSTRIGIRRRRVPGRLNVTLRMYLEPREEFRQIFKEGWRNQRDYLYVTNAHGADWKKAQRDATARSCRT